MPRECTCGGSNENCIHCFGTGVRAGRSPSVDRTAEPQVQVGEGLFKCPYCPISFRPNRLRHHLESVHPAMVGLKPPPLVREVLRLDQRVAGRPHEPEVIHCIRCGAEVPKQYFDAHFAAHTTFGKRAIALERAGLAPVAQRVPNVRTRRSPKKPRTAGRSNLVTCPYCPAQVSTKNVQKHCARVHGKTWSAHKGGAGTKPKTSKKSPKPTARKRATTAGTDQGLDATRFYYRYRESGRFGSHPSHDDHGDEGTP